MFTAHPEALTGELVRGQEWLDREIRKAAPERGLGAWSCEVAYGRRHSGGVGGVPEISQWGYLASLARPGGAVHDLTCFFEESTVEEDPELCLTIIGLWLDRLSG